MSTSERPLISVLMPVFNGERYVAEAIESILNQTYGNFEFIIINDGSTDETLPILQRFEKKDNRIRLASRDNKGLVASLNEGIAMANGDYLARMDADDVSMNDRFEMQVDYLLNNGDCVLLGTKVIIIDEDGDEICNMVDHYGHDDLINGFLVKEGQLIYHPSVMCRLVSLRDVGGYSYKYPHIEDLDLFFRISKVGKIANLDRPLLKYREHFNKIGALYSAEQDQQINKLLAEVYLDRGLGAYKNNQNIECNISRADRYRLWGWWSLKAGNTSTARKYAKKALFATPCSLESLRLFYCSLRGY